MSMRWQGRKVQVMRDAAEGDIGFDKGKGKQVVVRFEDGGGNQVVLASDVSEPRKHQARAGQPARKWDPDKTDAQRREEQRIADQANKPKG